MQIQKIIPQSITLEIVPTVGALKKYGDETVRLRVVTQTGFIIIESTPLCTRKSIPGMREYGKKYAKRFGIQFRDATEQSAP